jgi:hypothetical protein
MKKTLVFFLLFSLFFALVPVVQVGKATSSSYWVNVETSEVMGFRDSSVSISVSSNASQVTVRILDPSQAIIYEQVWSGNESRGITVPAQADYGTYTIKAVVGDVVTTMWFTVLDVSNWSPASFPYIRYHKGVAYKFYANGTILAENSRGDTLNVDLSTLRTLISQFSLDASAVYNSMNFRVRVSKAAFVVDLTFSFIHTGCKFTINGTLDQARSFTFKMPNPSAFKSLVDGVKTGSLVFDYGDLRKVAYAFSYDKANGELTVNIPKTFWIDPTIFESDFESESFAGDGWTATTTSAGSTSEVISTAPYGGTYHAHFLTDAVGDNNAYAYKILATGQSTLCVRGYYKFNSLQNGDGNGLIQFDNTTTYTGALLKFVLSGGKWYLRIRYNANDGAGWQNSAMGTTELSVGTGTYQSLELDTTIAVAGSYTAYIDGVEELSVTDVNNSACGNLDQVIVGLKEIYNGKVCDIYVDNVVVDDEYIGEETSTYTWTLQARDKDSANLPRQVTFVGNYENGTAFSATSSSAGLATITGVEAGNHTVYAAWQSHNSANTTVDFSENTTTNIDTRIARLDSGSNYVLVSVDGTALNSPTEQANNGWKIESVAGTSQKQVVADLANWLVATEPAYFKVAGNTFDKAHSGWSFSSNIFTFNYVDFDAFSNPTLEMVWGSGDGSPDGVPSAPSVTPTPAPTEPPSFTVPTVPTQPQPLVTEQPPIVIIIIAACIFGLIGIVIYVDQTKQSGWKKLKSKSKKKPDWKK